MVLAIDVGNSNIVLGGYRDGQTVFVARTATDRRMEADQYAVLFRGVLSLYGVAPEDIDGIVLASVVASLTPGLLRAIGLLTELAPMVFSLAHHGDIVIDIERPGELGTDILAGALAVADSRPLPAVVVDMGTATKLTAVDAQRRLRGVAIAPGLFVSLDALVTTASTLGGIPLEAPAAAIGRNTADSMKSGVVLGSAAMLDGMIDRFAAEMGGVESVVATGGGAGVVVPHCSHRIELCETLLLDGLYKAWRQQGGAAGR